MKKLFIVILIMSLLANIILAVYIFRLRIAHEKWTMELMAEQSELSAKLHSHLINVLNSEDTNKIDEAIKILDSSLKSDRLFSRRMRSAERWE